MGLDPLDICSFTQNSDPALARRSKRLISYYTSSIPTSTVVVHLAWKATGSGGVQHFVWLSIMTCDFYYGTGKREVDHLLYCFGPLVGNPEGVPCCYPSNGAVLGCFPLRPDLLVV